MEPYPKSLKPYAPDATTQPSLDKEYQMISTLLEKMFFQFFSRDLTYPEIGFGSHVSTRRALSDIDATRCHSLQYCGTWGQSLSSKNLIVALTESLF